MDSEYLKSRLKKATLILGNVANTIEESVESLIDPTSAPVGFISFDLDYYSSTVEAFKLFEYEKEYFLPRVFCYFDDCIGDDWELHSEFTGELLAINEFNIKNREKKLGKINGLRYKRSVNSFWNEQMYVLHIFTHSLYCRHIKALRYWRAS